MFSKLKGAIKALMLKAMDRILVNDVYMAYHGNDLYFILWDLDNDFFRKHIKYNPDLTGKEYKLLEEGRDMLYELMEKYGVDFDHVE
jgi:hypothetical protein